MEDWKKEQCLLTAKSAKYMKKVNDTEADIQRMLQIAKAPFVSCSFGKDSSAMADMIISIDKTIPLRFLSSGETRIIHPNIDEVINYFIEKGATIQEINIDRIFTEEWRNATWDEQRRAGKGDLQRYLNASNFDCIFIGLRAGESKTRQMNLNMFRTDGLPPFCYKYKETNMIRSCPLATWTTYDVGAYLITRGIPYLRWYDREGFEGRTTARLTRSAVEMGTLTWVRRYNPIGWTNLVNRFPEFKCLV